MKELILGERILFEISHRNTEQHPTTNKTLGIDN